MEQMILNIWNWSAEEKESSNNSKKEKENDVNEYLKNKR